MLKEIYDRYRSTENTDMHGDKGSTHSYLEVYDELFSEYRSRVGIKFLEVGVAAGLSLRMWREYFGAGATIVGCDPFDQWMDDDLKRDFPIHVGYSNVPSARHRLNKLSGFTGYDIIIDDGDHNPAVQFMTFWNLRPLLRPGGVYVIEDVYPLDEWRKEFELLDQTCQIFDLRNIKGKADDVLVVYR
jgi:hypothetical protein